MCGIAGFVSREAASGAPAKASVQRMCDRMAARGPDAEGLWAGEGVVLGHRRLAILDLDTRANQPMASSDGRHVIVFNGEIYNFRELRKTLEIEGVAFRTASDTEVLLALFAREGERMLPRLRGMFAFAIWDTHSRALFLARDPYGIKPLYYAETGDGLVFASQVKAIQHSGLVPSTIEPAGLAGFYLWGSVPEPWTMFRNVLSLPAGHWLKAGHDRKPSLASWHDIRQHWQGEAGRLPQPELREKVRQAVTDSVRAHLVADVPVCVFLSGGIDSGTIAGQIAGLGAKVEAITISFDEFRGRPQDETTVAAAIARHYGLKHHVRKIGRTEFEEDIARILKDMDQPSVDGVNTWFACQAAAERGYKVVLSGVGGDELFCGYASFQRLPAAAVWGRLAASVPGARRLLGLPFGLFARWQGKPKFAQVPAFMDSIEGAYFLGRALYLPGELPSLMGSEMAREGLAKLGGWPPGMTGAGARNDVAAVGFLESSLYMRNQLLRDSDWASMAHSLELRTPLVDVRLLETLGPHVSDFAAKAGKRMLAESPACPLPESIVGLRKSGFSVPMSEWLTAQASQAGQARMPAAAVPGVAWARSWARTLAQGHAGGAN